MGDLDTSSGDESGKEKSAFQELGDDKGEGSERDIPADNAEASQGGRQQLPGQGQRQQGDDDLDRDRETDLGRGDMR